MKVFGIRLTKLLVITLMTKYSATAKQIKEIKAAIKRHNMKAVTWQSVAARPSTIAAFLKATGK